jgi:hypothetical protein
LQRLHHEYEPFTVCPDLIGLAATHNTAPVQRKPGESRFHRRKKRKFWAALGHVFRLSYAQSPAGTGHRSAQQPFSRLKNRSLTRPCNGSKESAVHKTLAATKKATDAKKSSASYHLHVGFAAHLPSATDSSRQV